MGTALVEVLIKEKPGQDNILKPLTEGLSVSMVVTDPKMRVKKRASVPVMLIAPVSMYGMEGTDLLISMPGYGCEVLDPYNVDKLVFYRLGLTSVASRALASEMKKLFKK